MQSQLIYPNTLPVSTVYETVHPLTLPLSHAPGPRRTEQCSMRVSARSMLTRYTREVSTGFYSAAAAPLTAPLNYFCLISRGCGLRILLLFEVGAAFIVASDN